MLRPVAPVGCGEFAVAINCHRGALVEMLEPDCAFTSSHPETFSVNAATYSQVLSRKFTQPSRRKIFTRKKMSNVIPISFLKENMQMVRSAVPGSSEKLS